MKITTKTTIITYKEPAKAAASGNRKAVLENCSDIRTLAALLCPVEFGQLRNTLTYTMDDGIKGPFNEEGLEVAPEDQRISTPPRQLFSKAKGFVGTASDHWYPEFGTLRMIAQPFLRPAFDHVVRGGSAQQTAAKYNREAMVREFNIRKEKVSRSG